MRQVRQALLDIKCVSLWRSGFFTLLWLIFLAICDSWGWTTNDDLSLQQAEESALSECLHVSLILI